MIKQNKIRLKGSGSVVSHRRLPEGFIDTITGVISKCIDPSIFLAGYSYMIGGMKINEIRDRFVLIDQGRVRIASREYVRQKIVTFYEMVYSTYSANIGDGSVSPIHIDSNLETSIFNYMSKVNIETVENIINNETDDNETPTPKREPGTKEDYAGEVPESEEEETVFTP